MTNNPLKKHTPKVPKNHSLLNSEPRLPALGRKVYWLVGLGVGLLFLTNLGILGEILAEGFRLLLEVAEEGIDTVLELTGLTPRLAQGVTAYIGFVAALLVVYRLWRKCQTLLQDINQQYSQIKAKTQQIISNMPTTVRTAWVNLPLHQKAMLSLGGLAVLAFIAFMAYILI